MRIIAASDRDLVPQVKIHQFREDLFYGLNIIALRLPPLGRAFRRHFSFSGKYARRRGNS